MKRLLAINFYFIICSCTKDPNNTSNNNNSDYGSIQYKVNGVLTTIENADLLTGQYAIISKFLKGSSLSATIYQFNAQKGPNNLIAFSIVTDSLQQKNYHLDSTKIANTISLSSYIVLVNAEQSQLIFNGDYFDLNITNYKNGRVSGTFTAKYTPIGLSLPGFYGPHGSTIITDGIIKNIPVQY